jgi:hypothetical protein
MSKEAGNVLGNQTANGLALWHSATLVTARPNYVYGPTGPPRKKPRLE